MNGRLAYVLHERSEQERTEVETMRQMKSPSFRYRKGLSRQAPGLLLDPLSEMTRKRQVALVIAASASMLLSAEFVTIKEISLNITSFTITTPRIATWLASAMTLYFLMMFLLGARGDWVIGKVNRWSPLASFQTVRAQMESDHLARVEAGKKRKAEVDELQKHLVEIRRQRRELMDSLEARRKQIGLELASESIDVKQRSQLDRESAELDRSRLDAWLSHNALETPLERQLMALTAKSVSSLGQMSSMLDEKSDIDSTLQTFLQLTRLRFWLEIALPATYATLALLWVIARSYGKPTLHARCPSRRATITRTPRPPRAALHDRFPAPQAAVPAAATCCIRSISSLQARPR